MDTEAIITQAEQACILAGVKLTEKRKRILFVLLEAGTPLSAYEIADKVKTEFEATVPAMSVYRMLDFLIGENLAHKLNSENKFVACSHITCDHTHRVPQFLICDKCRKVREITIPKVVIASLSETIDAAGYHLLDTQLELPCICDSCK